MALMGRTCGRNMATQAVSSGLSKSSTPKQPRLSPVYSEDGEVGGAKLEESSGRTINNVRDSLGWAATA